MNRREAIRAIAGSAGATAGLPDLRDARAAGVCPAHQTTELAATATYAPRFFTPRELETLAALCEAVIPSDEHSPGARAALVHQFIDDLVADLGDGTKRFWRNGLAVIDALAEKNFRKKFADCSPDSQNAILREISAHEEHPEKPEEHFFRALKRSTIEGYYTSATGIHQELEYQGNTAVADFPGCAHENHKA